ncbi:MAG TPA: hypothetical protein VIC59_06160 [Gemmatimonadota bacterium]
MTVFVVLAICAVVFLVLARPFRHGSPGTSSGARPDGGATVSTPTDDSPRALPASTPSPDGIPVAPSPLLDEKDRIFQALADLRFDYEAGKLSREDFEEEDARLRARAAGVLRELGDPA